jgi:hypothetical protein
MVAIKKLVNVRELKRDYDNDPRRCVRELSEALEARHLRPDNFSLRDLYEGFCGYEALRAIDPFRKSGGMAVDLLEAGNAVNTAAFSSITGQIVYNRIREAFEAPEFIWPKLVQTIQTQFLNGERIPGIGQLGNMAESVKEGMPYPMIGTNEEYVDTAPLTKRGFIVPVTREIIVADRTGILLKRCDEGGNFLGVNKELRCIDVAVGNTNNYKRNGTAYNTYLASGAWVNTSANSLTGGQEWKAIQAAELIFNGITDPNTGLPIVITPKVVLAPTALKWDFNRILTATQVQHVDNQVNAVTVRTQSANPLVNQYELLSNSYVKLQSSSATKWWIGDAQKAFAYMEAWAIESLQAATNSEAEFTQDIMQRYKVSEMGVAQVLEPRYMVQNT